MSTPSTPPQIGEKALLFALPNHDGVMTNPADSLGKYVIIYFYPKALTSGCTTQACDLRDNWEDFRKAGVSIFGISPDQPKILKKFKNDKELPFELLSDADHTMATAYDTWKQKSMYGRTYMGMMRDTYVLDPHGTVILVLHKANISTHAGLLLSAISKHSSRST